MHFLADKSLTDPTYSAALLLAVFYSFKFHVFITLLTCAYPVYICRVWLFDYFNQLTNLLWYVTPGGGVLPYMGYTGMCGPKGYGFSSVLDT